MRLRPRAYVCGAVHVTTDEGKVPLIWCSRRWHVYWYPRWRWRWWWVPTMSWALRLGRLEVQWLAT